MLVIPDHDANHDMKRFALFLSLALCMSASSYAEDADDETLERLGKLSGELLLHAGVLKKLDARCPSGRPAVDYTAVLDGDLKTLPDNIQSMMVMQTGTALKIADFIAQGIVDKAKGCDTEAFRRAYAHTESEFQMALQAWRQRGRR